MTTQSFATQRIPICPKCGSDLVQAPDDPAHLVCPCGWVFPSAEPAVHDGLKVAPADDGRLGLNLTSELHRLQRRPAGIFDPLSKGQAIKRVDVREPQIMRLLEEFDRREYARPRYSQRRAVFLDTVNRYYREASRKSKAVLDEMTRGHEFDEAPAKGRRRYDQKLDPRLEERGWT